jgi:hypothetical protein
MDTIADDSSDRSSKKFRDRLTALVAHEGEHGLDQRAKGMPTDRASEKAGEIRASTVQATVFQGLNSEYGVWLWTPDKGLQPNGIETSAEASTAHWCQATLGGCQ